MSDNPIGYFPRGSTFSGNGQFTVALTDGTNLEGQEVVFQDFDLSTSPFGPRTVGNNNRVRCRIVRNVSGVALLPGQLVTFKAGKEGFQVDGECCTTGQRSFPVDEFLPAAGVANNDLFYIVIEGYAKILTDLAGGINNSFAAGVPLVALTAATSGATTSGRFAPQTFAAVTAATGFTTTMAASIAAQMQIIGYAVSANTTGQTNNLVLANITKF